MISYKYITILGCDIIKINIPKSKSYPCKIQCILEREGHPFKKDMVYDGEIFELYGEGNIHYYHINIIKDNKLDVICVKNDRLFNKYMKIIN